MSEVEGFGTTLSYGSTADYVGESSWTPIAKLVDLDPPEPECDDIETTNRDSTEKWREFQGGLKNGGEAKFSCRFTKAQFATLEGLLGTKKAWQIQFTDGTGPTTGSTFKFNGHIKKIGPKTPMDKTVDSEITIKVSGKPLFAAGT